MKLRFSIFILVFLPYVVEAQNVDHYLTLRGALDSGVKHNYTLLTKRNIQKAKFLAIKTSRSESLPDLTFSAQQDFGTINSTFGPIYSYRGLGVSSSGPVRSAPSWNSAFGALYLANIQWDFFAFGKTKEKIKLSKQIYTSSQEDVNQLEFQLKIKISAAYLNLLAANTLLLSQKANLNRALSLRQVVLSRTLSGLNPGVDSSIAGAQVSSARIALNGAEQTVEELQNSLGILMGIPPQKYILDSLYSQTIPKKIDTFPPYNPFFHPSVRYYQSLLGVEDQNIRYLKKTALPVFTLFDVFQGRGSGFYSYYGDGSPNGFTQNYFKGINPSSTNYLVGIGVIWNITHVLQVHHQTQEQEMIRASLKNEFDRIQSEIMAEQNLSEKRLINALKQFKEGPIQVKAAKEAYLQKSTLFKNGLTSIVDITQTLFALNQAETQMAIIYNNIWSALLLKSASNGDFNQFLNQLP